MSKFGLRLNRSAISPSANLIAARLSSTPREGQPVFLGGSSWDVDSLITHHQWQRTRNGVNLGSPIITAGTDPAQWDWAAADNWTQPGATEAVSLDGGATYSTPVPVVWDPTYETDVVTPAVIAAGTATRTSSSGSAALAFDILGDFASPYLREILELDTNFNVLYTGRTEITEAERNTPFNADTTLVDPPIPTSVTTNATRVELTRFITPDWMAVPNTPTDQAGTASPWMGVSATDRAGYRYWRLDVASGQFFLAEIAFLLSGGVNVAPYSNPTFSDPPPYGGGGDPRHFFDGGVNYGALTTPGYVILEVPVPVQPTILRLTAWVGANAPTNFTLKHSTDGVTYSAAVVTQSGLTWLDNEIKDFTIP